MPKTCSICLKPKSLMNFTIISRKPVVYRDSCMVCDPKNKTKFNEKEIETHMVKKETARVRRVQNKARQVDKAKDKLRYEKQKKEKEAIAMTADGALASRILARRRLIHFVIKFTARYVAGWVHYDICRRLEQFIEQVEQGLEPRLLLFMPPRHGKSEIASIKFPAYVLGKHPEWEIIDAGYALTLPLGFSRKTRALLRDPEYKATFPHTHLDPESQSAETWMTTKGGGYVAAGVGGGITGKGANIFIFDDPVKDAEEADSETARERVWNWWGSVAYTRLAPGGGILGIQTRWHDADLSGKLIEQMLDELKSLDALRIENTKAIAAIPDTPEATSSESYTQLISEKEELEKQSAEIERWEVISYPAIATHDEYLNKKGDLIQLEPEEDVPYDLKKLRSKGEALHEERYSLATLKRKKRGMQPRHWSALFQQNPVPEEGIFFTKADFHYVLIPPPFKQMRIFSAWDLAIGERQTHDYTVGIVAGIDWQDMIYILKMYRGRWALAHTAKLILDVEEKYHPMRIGVERGQLELALRPELKKLIKKRRLYPTFDDTLVPISDKLVRARPLQGRMQQGMVMFPMNQPWTEVVRHELLRFHGGVFDDIVDAMAWMARMSVNISPPRPPKDKTKNRSWKNKLKHYTQDSGSSKDPMAA